jgi:hypothetical protein
MVLMHVLLPAPFRPSNASSWPAFTENETPCNTWLSP